MQVLTKSIITIIPLLWISTTTLAQPLTILVSDQLGKPLNGAVVEIVDNTSASTDNSNTSETAIMDQINKRFVPDLLVITQGQAVNFPNSDNIRHHVYSFSKAKPFELKLYAGKPEKPITFEQHGVVLLGCNIHDSMVGSIYVAKNEALTTAEDGVVNFESKTLINQISVWHPLQSNNPEQRLMINVNELLQDQNNSIAVSIAVEEPAPRDTFSDTFSGQK